VRAEDERSGAIDAGEKQDDSPTLASTAEGRAIISVGAGNEAESEESGDTVKPLPDRLLTELTAFRTLALRDALARTPQVAFTALLHTLCCELFGHQMSTGCLQVFLRDVSFPVQAPDLKASEPARAIAAQQASWAAQVPGDEDALWDWISSLDGAARAALLAHCVSHGVNALYDKADRYGSSGLERRIAHADRLARAVSLDPVTAGWRPTVENYLGRVPKARILEAVREARGDDAVRLIEHLKKTDMAKEAERLLDGAGWLPEPLRTTSSDPSSAEGDALPEFLGGPDDEAADGNPEVRGMAAD
jgi:ParB family chromosome partitioning protein